jgi:hypothetical protein
MVPVAGGPAVNVTLKASWQARREDEPGDEAGHLSRMSSPGSAVRA